MYDKTLIFYLNIFSCLVQIGTSQKPVPIDDLKLKGTHNSYACCGGGNSCPVMRNPPNEQIDDYGVWALELDFSVKKSLGGIPTLYIGHDAVSGDGSFTTPEWGSTLKEYLVNIKKSKSFKYRPLIVYFEHKLWGDDEYNSELYWVCLLNSLINEVFTSSEIFGRNDFTGTWPTVNELSEKIIPYADFDGKIKNCSQFTINLFANKKDNDEFSIAPFNRWHKDYYTSGLEVDQIVHSNKNYNIISIDQYQEDWTFKYFTPPNPIYTRTNALDCTAVINKIGNVCFGFNDPTTRENKFFVHQQGTFKFPFDNVKAATDRAYPGWTILLATGNFREKLIISKRLILKAESGVVIIGK